MADDIFDKKKIIAALRAQGIPEKDIEKLYGRIPQPVVNSAKAEAFKQQNAWKYKNKHKRPVLQEDIDADYEPIEELRKKTGKKPTKPRITKKKAKIKAKPPKNDWNAASEARLKALYEAGYTVNEMAAEFKTTADAITGKLSRMRKAGWKGQVGTTHAPLPSSKPNDINADTRKMSPLLKRMLANSLEKNFGAVGRFFSKKWGLIDENDKKKGGKGGGSADVTAAVIKSNEMVMNALSKLDTSLRRGTSTLTKSISRATAKMTDAVHNVTEIIRKGQVAELTKSSPTDKPGSGGAGGAGAVGVIAALLGGAGLAMLLGSNANAHADGDSNMMPETSEDVIRQENTPTNKEDIIPEMEIKVKELTFDADDITFEADDIKFKNNGNQSGGGQTQPKAGPTSTTKPSGGMLNGLMDKLGAGGGGSGFFNGLMDKLSGTGGIDGKGGDSDGASKGPIPSDSEMDAKDKSWFKRKGGGEGGDKDSGGKDSGKDGSKEGGAPPSDYAGTTKSGTRAEIYDALRGVGGMSHNQASAILGHAEVESKFNPNAYNKGEGAAGILQMRADRKARMEKYAASKGEKGFGSARTQAEFFAKDIKEGYEGKQAKKFWANPNAPISELVKESGKNIIRHSHRGNEANPEARLKRAEEYGKEFAGTEKPKPESPPSNYGLNQPSQFDNTQWPAGPVGAPTQKDEGRVPLGAGEGGDTPPTRIPVYAPRGEHDPAMTGKVLQEQQKEADDAAKKGGGEGGGSSGDGGSSSSNDQHPSSPIHVASIYETQGPNHFAGYPGFSTGGSDHGVGA